MGELMKTKGHWMEIFATCLLYRCHYVTLIRKIK